MSTYSRHAVNPGALISEADFSYLFSMLDGDAVNSPNTPMLEVSSGGSLTAQTYRYCISYINWRLSSGKFEIIDETSQTVDSSIIISSYSSITTSASQQVKVYIEPPRTGSANGIIIYRNDTSPFTTSSDYRAVTIVTDLSLEYYLDNISTANRGKIPLLSSTFQEQPFIGNNQLSNEFPIAIDPSNTVSTYISNNSPFLFDREEDFMLCGINYVGKYNSAYVDIYTSTNSYKIWSLNNYSGSRSSNFLRPIPIPYSEAGLRTSETEDLSISIYGYYTGIKRGSSSFKGSIHTFMQTISGPYLTPSKQFTCPKGSQASIVFINSDGINSQQGGLILFSDAVAEKLNSDSTYVGKYWYVGKGAINSVNSVLDNTSYKGHMNTAVIPIQLNQGESITAYSSIEILIAGYVYSNE